MPRGEPHKLHSVYEQHREHVDDNADNPVMRQVPESIATLLLGAGAPSVSATIRKPWTVSDGQASPRSTQNSARGPRAPRAAAAIIGGGVPPVLPALSGVHGASDLTTHTVSSGHRLIDGVLLSL